MKKIDLFYDAKIKKQNFYWLKFYWECNINQLNVLHNSDTGIGVEVLVYIKDILRGKFGGYPPFILHPLK